MQCKRFRFIADANLRDDQWSHHEKRAAQRGAALISLRGVAGDQNLMMAPPMATSRSSSSNLVPVNPWRGAGGEDVALVVAVDHIDVHRGLIDSLDNAKSEGFERRRLEIAILDALPAIAGVGAPKEKHHSRQNQAGPRHRAVLRSTFIAVVLTEEGGLVRVHTTCVSMPTSKA